MKPHYIYIQRPLELFIDIDNDYYFSRYCAEIKKAKAKGLIKSGEIVSSFTPGHTHAIIQLIDELSSKHKVILASLLGNDNYKTAFDAIRIMQGCENILIISPHKTLPFNRKPDRVCHCMNRHQCKTVLQLNTTKYIPKFF